MVIMGNVKQIFAHLIYQPTLNLVVWGILCAIFLAGKITRQTAFHEKKSRYRKTNNLHHNVNNTFTKKFTSLTLKIILLTKHSQSDKNLIRELKVMQ